MQRHEPLGRPANFEGRQGRQRQRSAATRSAPKVSSQPVPEGRSSAGLLQRQFLLPQRLDCFIA